MEWQSSQTQGKRLHSFPWWGGKYRLAPEIIRHFSAHRIYVEVFGGSGSVLLAKSPSPIEVYNDNDGLLVNLFETIRNRPSEFVERARFLLYSRQLYETWSRDVFKHPTPVEGNIELAVRTYYAIVSGFGGDPTKGWAFERTNRHGGSARWASVISRIELLSERLRHVNIDHLDFRDCISHWDTPSTLFYCDPPYLSNKGHGYYHFELRDHLDLCSLLGTVKGKWLLSYDDTPKIRQLYHGYSIIPVETVLSMQKKRLGEKRLKFRQVLIANYPLEV